MNDFTGEDYDFAAGAIYGMRSWGIDEHGRLHGVTHAEVWLPGENVSVCKKAHEIPCPSPARPRDHLPRSSGGVVEPKKKRNKRRGYEMTLPPWEIEAIYPQSASVHARCGDPSCYAGRHTVPSNHRFDPDCECGFWAYDEQTFNEHGSVTGIIQGYGKTTIGTRGFRCEKATVAALCRTHVGKPLSLSLWLRLQQLYPDAKFYEDRDDMVTAHGGVLHNWPAVDEGFWVRPVKKKTNDLFLRVARAAGAFTVPTSHFTWNRP